MSPVKLADGTTFRMIGMKWQLNIAFKELNKSGIETEFAENDTCLLIRPKVLAQQVAMATISSNSVNLPISRIDYEKHEYEGQRRYIVYNKDIVEQCMKFAVENNLLEETFIELGGGTSISEELMHMNNYKY